MVDRGTHKFNEKVRDGSEELERFVRMLSTKGRLTDAMASQLLCGPTSATTIMVASQEPVVASGQSRRVFGWDESAVSSWLEALGLGAHVGAFTSARVDGRLLLELDDEDLLELGVTSRLQRKLVLTRRNGLVD